MEMFEYRGVEDFEAALRVLAGDPSGTSRYLIVGRKWLVFTCTSSVLRILPDKFLGA